MIPLKYIRENRENVEKTLKSTLLALSDFSIISRFSLIYLSGIIRLKY